MKRYDSYKDSGVEWIGEIPKNWSVKRLKWITEVENSGIWGEDEEFSNSVNVPIPTTGQLSIDGEWYYDKMNLRNLSLQEWVKYKCIEGDIVVVKSSGSSTNIITGKCGYISKEDSEKFGFSNFLLRVRPNKMESKLVYYFLSSNLTKQRIERMVSSTTYPNLKVDEYSNSELLIPPLYEQQQIVSFLDTKTSLIDSLIEKTQRKIELLKEKRTSLINEVVTKGLNPNVEMKDSGVEWIGEIPSGWETGKLKNNSDLKISSVDKHIFEEEIQVIVCNYTDVYYNEFITSELPLRKGSCSENEYSNFILKRGDVIITKDSESPTDIGVPSLVKENLDNVVCGYHLSIIKSNPKKLVGGYLFRQLQTKRIRSYFEINSNGITRFGLGKSSVLETPLILPPINEQEQIVEYLDDQTQLIDNTISIEEKRIELLKEYRQSLISEVVTGKLKVTTDE